MYYGGSSYMLWQEVAFRFKKPTRRTAEASTKFVSEHLDYWENLIGSCV